MASRQFTTACILAGAILAGTSLCCCFFSTRPLDWALSGVCQAFFVFLFATIGENIVEDIVKSALTMLVGGSLMGQGFGDLGDLLGLSVIFGVVFATVANQGVRYVWGR